MAKFLKNLIQYILISYVVFTVLKGIILPTNLLYIIASFLVLSIGMLMASPILKFLTVRENFVTIFLMSSLICIGFFFLLDSFMTGFYIETYTFEGLELGNILVNSFEMTPFITIVIGSIFASFLGSLLSVLEKTS